jgi:hypothetical protein
VPERATFLAHSERCGACLGPVTEGVAVLPEERKTGRDRIARAAEGRHVLDADAV